MVLGKPRTISMHISLTEVLLPNGPKASMGKKIGLASGQSILDRLVNIKM